MLLVPHGKAFLRLLLGLDLGKALRDDLLRELEVVHLRGDALNRDDTLCVRSLRPALGSNVVSLFDKSASQKHRVYCGVIGAQRDEDRSG